MCFITNPITIKTRSQDNITSLFAIKKNRKRDAECSFLFLRIYNSPEIILFGYFIIVSKLNLVHYKNNEL